MLHLRIEPVRTTSQLRTAANPNELAADGYTVEDGYVVVEDQAEADELLSRYSNLELDLERGAERDGELDRATVTEDGVEHSNDEPDTCQAVKSDGEVCGRERPCQYHD